MLKRIALFLLVVTAVPAVMLSSPVWADDEELTITLETYETLYHFKIYDADGLPFKNYTQNLISGWTETIMRSEPVRFAVSTADYQDKKCTVEGYSDGYIPLTQAGDEPIKEAHVAVTLENSTPVCKVTLPALPENKLEMVVIAAEGVVLPTDLEVTDYQGSSRVGNAVIYTVAGNETLWHTVYSSADASEIDAHSNVACKFSDNTQRVTGAKVYVSILENSCSLSLTEPTQPGEPPVEPPPPGPPAPIEIGNCDQLMNIKDLSVDYVITSNLSCGDYAPIAGTFTGTLTSKGCDIQSDSCSNTRSISSLGINANNANNAKDVGLFASIKDATIAHIKFYGAEVTAAAGANRGLIAGVATDSTLNNISVDALSILDNGNNISTASYATGGLIGIGDNVTLSNIHLGKDQEEIMIQRNRYAGGLIGIAKGDTTITRSSVQSLDSKNVSCDANHPGGNCGFGGLVGVVMKDDLGIGNLVIDRSSAQGEIDAKYNAGGLIGFVKAEPSVTISNSYSVVKLQCSSGCRYAGGLIGQGEESTGANMGDIKLGAVYAAGKINAPGDPDAGQGIIGFVSEKNKEFSARVSRINSKSESFFDSGSTTKHYSGDNISESRGTDAMKKVDTYDEDSWDRDIWKIESGSRPTLK